ncbi:FAD/NAD(P)-binding domain-containing protein, partial [Aureobasidium namibiae CBS 147.97]
LDQLGCREALYACVEPVQWVHDRDQHGRLLAKPSSVSQLAKARSGYSFAFSDRQNILEVLYDNLKDKSKVLVGKNLTTVRQHASGVTVICEDGSAYVGDVLAGADGVNSKARSEMWRLADEEDPELVKNDKSSLESQYQCLYGIASSSSGLPAGEIDVGYNEKRSTMAIVGKNDRTYYFVFEKMNKTYKDPHIPKYTEADKIEFAERHGDMKVTDKVLLRDLHKNSVSSTLVGIETATYKIWTWGRIACLGDSAHKMTPNAGFGGNQAIESAAALANSIKKLSDTSNGQRPTQDQVVACLHSYQKLREVRAAAAIQASNFLTHVQALATWGHALFARYGLNYMGDFLENLTSDVTVGAVAIDYLPLPEGSLRGWMPFNPEQGQGMKENLLVRAALAMPFLAVFAFAWKISSAVVGIGGDGLASSAWYSARLMPSSLTTSPWGFGGQFNSSASMNNTYTTTSANVHPATNMLTTNFLSFSGVVLSIWSIEAIRCCNALMPVQLPLLFTVLAQRRGLGVVAPLYSFVHWVLTPIDTFKSTDMRLTKMHYTKAVLPSLLMTFYLPLIQVWLLPEVSQRQTWLQLWQYFPVTLSLGQFAMSKIWKDTADQDKIERPKRDVATLRYTIGVPTGVATMFWLYTLCASPVSFSRLFLAHNITTTLADFSSTSALTPVYDLLQYNYLIAILSTYLWLLYFVWDAKVAGIVTQSWLTVLAASALATVVLGPGGAVGAGFLWREYIITEKRHKGALTSDKVRRGVCEGKE